MAQASQLFHLASGSVSGLALADGSGARSGAQPPLTLDSAVAKSRAPGSVWQGNWARTLGLACTVTLLFTGAPVAFAAGEPEELPLPPPPPVGAAAPAAVPKSPALVDPPKAAAVPAGAGVATMDAAPRGEQFRDLERRVGDLKDQVFRSKARLSLLGETLMSVNVGTTRAVITHRDQMTRLYQTVRVSYQLDGREVFTREAPQTATAQATELAKELVVFDGSLKPGDHTLGVTVTYRGNGAKVFAYYHKFTFTAKAAQRFQAREGQTTKVVVTCQEKGNALSTKLEDRPSFDFQVTDAADKDGKAK